MPSLKFIISLYFIPFNSIVNSADLLLKVKIKLNKLFLMNISNIHYLIVVFSIFLNNTTYDTFHYIPIFISR